jgi:hypothetical protein
MNPGKLFALAVLVASTAMASGVTSSAMAESTALCKVDEESPCQKENQVTHVHETSVGKAVLKSSLPTIECNVLFLGDTGSSYIEIKGVRVVYLEPLTNPLFIVGNFSYSSCNNFCSVKEESTFLTELKVLKVGAELDALTGKALVHVSCPFINCNYIGTGLEGHGLGPLTSKSGANGSVVLTEQNTEKESGSCPEEAFLTITTTPLSATYISS